MSLDLDPRNLATGDPGLAVPELEAVDEGQDQGPGFKYPLTLDGGDNDARAC